jgi:hypothetical protein
MLMPEAAATGNQPQYLGEQRLGHGNLGHLEGRHYGRGSPPSR